MASTPILDFARAYAASGPARLHMPGHKGTGPLGCEGLDITEIDGADGLYAPSGIVAASEAEASRLFGCPTFYSAEGSSLAVRAMLLLALAGRGSGERPVVLAGRNAHQSFLSAAVLLDFDVQWLYPEGESAYHGCPVSPARLDAALARLGRRCRAVYVTSPDYLGHVADIASLSGVCRLHGALLLVDNAHGGYLRFLKPSRHPIDLGADMCCDSAHKTLPALTGAAWLHLRRGLNVDAGRVKAALALFGSSSPSWLILQSLDACNPYLEGFAERLEAFLPRVAALREALKAHGCALAGDEPMKLTLRAKPFGYTGDALAAALIEQGVYPEFHDPDFLTLMPAPQNAPSDLDRLRDALLSVPRRAPLPQDAPAFRAPARAMSIREAAFAPREALPVGACAGRVLAASAVSCPPCVPVAVCGEVIDGEVIERLMYYGITECAVVAQS